MRKFLSAFVVLLIIFVSPTFTTKVAAQSFEFGVEPMYKLNSLSKWSFTENEPVFGIVDDYGDTAHIVFNSFTYSPNVEIPIFARYNHKNRFFVELGYGVSTSNLQADGFTDYNESFYTGDWAYNYYNDWYGVGPEGYVGFIESGFLDVFINSDDYNNLGITYDDFYSWYFKDYDALIREQERTSITYTESFKQRAIHLNAGYKFYPYKPIRPYVRVGLTYRAKFRQFESQTLNFENPYVLDKTVISRAIPTFDQDALYGKIGFGVESYRFRAGFDIEWAGVYPYTSGLNRQDRIVTYDYMGNVNSDETSFGNVGDMYTSVNTLSMYLGVNLSSVNIADNKYKKQLEQENFIAVTKFRQKDKPYAIGLRLNNYLYSNLYNYDREYSNLNVISFKDRIAFENLSDTLWDNDYYYEMDMLKIGRVKRVDWTPELEVFFRYKIFKKLYGENSLGVSGMKVDFETEEVNTNVWSYLDQSGPEPMWRYYYDGIYKNSGAFQVSYVMAQFSQNFYVPILKKENYTINLIAGFAGGSMIANGYNEEINDSDIKRDFYDAAYSQENFTDQYVSSDYTGRFMAVVDENSQSLNPGGYNNQDFNIDPMDDPERLLNYMYDPYDDVYLNTPEGFRENNYNSDMTFSTYKLGVEMLLGKFSVSSTISGSSTAPLDIGFIEGYTNVNLSVALMW